MFGQKRKKGKVLSRIKISIGLFFGAIIGMVFSPKKGREVRNYFKTNEFRKRMSEAKGRLELLGEFFKEVAQNLKNKWKM